MYSWHIGAFLHPKKPTICSVVSRDPCNGYLGGTGSPGVGQSQQLGNLVGHHERHARSMCLQLIWHGNQVLIVDRFSIFADFSWRTGNKGNKVGGFKLCPAHELYCPLTRKSVRV